MVRECCNTHSVVLKINNCLIIFLKIKFREQSTWLQSKRS